MDLIFKILQTILTVAIVIGIGYIAVAKKIADEKTAKTIASYLVMVAVPCTIIVKLYSLASINQAIIGIGLSSLNQIICLVIGLILAKIFKIPKKNLGVMVGSFAFCNSGFVGLPIVAMLFGDAAKNIAIYFIISNNLVFWTLGAYFIRKDAKHIGKKHLKSGIKNIINPPIVTFVIMMVVVALKLPLPSFILTTADMLETTTSPMALLFCGMILGGIGIKNIKWEKGFSLIMVGRYIVSPIVMALLFMLVKTDDLFRNVLIIQAAMPVITLVEVAAKKYEANVEYASLSFVFSMFVLFFALPIIYYFIAV